MNRKPIYIKATLRKGKESSVKRFHPWVFSGAIEKIEGKPKEGDIIEVFENNGNFLAAGHYQPSTIAVRIFTFKKQRYDYDFWKSKVVAALEFRKKSGLFNLEKLNVFRLLHGEGDDMPGFVADYFNGIVVFQFHSAGMWQQKDDFLRIFMEQEFLPVHTIYDKSSYTLPFKFKNDLKDQLLSGNKTEAIVNEYGNKFKVNVVEGQKTGFFIDQRENRKLLEEFCKGKKVLNLFCYTGGFSVSAFRAGATEVHSLDSSRPALEMCSKNIDLNFKSKDHTSFCDDATDYLFNSKSRYDVIIVDPPAYAKHNEVLDRALAGYRKLNKLAIKNLNPGGVLFTFSCSQAVSRQDFRLAVFSALAEIGRKGRILYQLSQPIDHPINIYHPEGEYLKGLVLYVE